jgi:hypothetical protein
MDNAPRHRLLSAMTTTKRAALYSRVPTGEQHTE